MNELEPEIHEYIDYIVETKARERVYQQVVDKRISDGELWAKIDDTQNLIYKLQDIKKTLETK